MAKKYDGVQGCREPHKNSRYEVSWNDCALSRYLFADLHNRGWTQWNPSTFDSDNPLVSVEVWYFHGWSACCTACSLSGFEVINNDEPGELSTVMLYGRETRVDAVVHYLNSGGLCGSTVFNMLQHDYSYRNEAARKRWDAYHEKLASVNKVRHMIAQDIPDLRLYPGDPGYDPFGLEVQFSWDRHTNLLFGGCLLIPERSYR